MEPLYQHSGSQAAGVNVTVTIGNKIALINNQPIELDVPAQVIQGRTLIPLRFTAEALGAEVSWDGATRRVYITTNGQTPPLSSPAPATSQGVTRETLNLVVNSRTVTVQLVSILPEAQLQPMVVLGDNRVGGVEDLASMAKRKGAVVAVNGTFFNPEDYAATNKLPTELAPCSAPAK